MTVRKRTFPIGPGVDCDLDRLISTRLLVQANSGGGKSWLLRRLLEQTHGKVQQIVIDPEGEFATLRQKFDYVLAARQGGDTLADPRTAKLLAERLLELGVSAIVDIYELYPRERIQFVKLFCEALVNAPKALWHPVLVVLDEAHVFCPEREEAESATAVSALCSLGRKRGFCAVLATQRISKLAKDAAAECNNKLTGRTSLDVDMKRAAEDLGFTDKQDKLALRDLEDGEFFVYGPAFKKGVQRVQVGPVQTEHPKAGSHLAAVVPPPTDKVKALLPKLSDLPAEAEAREKTTADLKRDLANVRRELTEAKKAQPPAPKAIEGKRVAVLTDADHALLEKLTNAIASTESTLKERSTKALESLRADLLGIFNRAFMDAETLWEPNRERFEKILDSKGFQKILGKLATVTPTPVNRPLIATPKVQVARRTPTERLQSAPSAPVRGSDEAPLPPGEHATLTAALQYPGLDRKRLGILTGYKRSSRDAYIARLSAKGLVEVNANALFPTEAGEHALNGSFEPLPVGDALLDYWRVKLPEGERATLEVLIAVGGADVAREAIDEATGYKRSSRDAYLTRLKARGLVEFSGRGTVRASQELFS